MGQVGFISSGAGLSEHCQGASESRLDSDDAGLCMNKNGIKTAAVSKT